MPNPIPDSRDDGQTYGFSAVDSERVATAVRRVEAEYRNALPQRRRGPVAGGVSLVRVLLPTGITAGSLGSPSSKTDCTILVRSGNGWTATGGVTGQTIYNCYETAISGTNKSAWAFRREDGTLELVVADC